MKININEVFYSIQGEGRTLGEPRLFIRLGGCNLRCKFCDTQYSYKGIFEDDSILEAEIIYDKNGVSNFSHFPNWVITGGEPLLQQEEIIGLFAKYNPDWLEIETNGTIKPLPTLQRAVNLFNISPKDPKQQKRGLKPKLAVNFKELERNSDYIVKFVYSNKSSEKFIKKTIKENKIDPKRVYIMAEGKNKKEQEEKMPEVIKYCLKNNYKFSPRLHVLVWNKKRGI